MVSWYIYLQTSRLFVQPQDADRQCRQGTEFIRIVQYARPCQNSLGCRSQRERPCSWIKKFYNVLVESITDGGFEVEEFSRLNFTNLLADSWLLAT